LTGSTRSAAWGVDDCQVGNTISIDIAYSDISATRYVEPTVICPGCINQTNLHCWIDSLPFGGVGMAGMGKYYGKAGFEALSNTKAMLVGNPT
jgi:acyl-CoA reductase-like NAD-dependent aldehyde dehydrogenase